MNNYEKLELFEKLLIELILENEWDDEILSVIETHTIIDEDYNIEIFRGI